MVTERSVQRQRLKACVMATALKYGATLQWALTAHMTATYITIKREEARKTKVGFKNARKFRWVLLELKHLERRMVRK